MEPLVPDQSPEKKLSKKERSSEFIPLTLATHAAGNGKNQQKGGAAGMGGHRDFKVEPVEVDGVVVSIKVHCSCGELIEIDCTYQE
jgi:hypothetical protein